MRYFGVLAAAAKWRPLVVPRPQPSQATEDGTAPDAASPVLVSAVVDRETNEVSATDVLNYVASIFARGDAKT